MDKFRKITLGIFMVAFVSIMCAAFMNKTYSYGAVSYITGEAGSYVLQFMDIDSGTDISCETAQKYYGVMKWQKKRMSGKYYYFYNCKQSTEAKYNDGYPKEIADIRARNKGKAAYRVSNTAEAKAAYDDIYKNHRTGVFSLEFAENESIDWNAVETYVLTKYGVTNYKTNYYNYAVKGEWEPIRYGLPDKTGISTGTVEIDMWRMRISGNELQVTENFVNKLLTQLKPNGSDYEKILAAYKYITSTTTYEVDKGFNNMLDSNTAIYDVFIERQSTCIGYSIAFSYLMDKMGIESYIVDQITTNDPSTETFGSVHTYNVVKLDGKFYKIDLTGNVFLKSASGCLSDSKLTIATSAYNTSGKPTTMSFNMNTINGYLSSAKGIKTTTTKKLSSTTTKQITTSVAKTTTKKTTTTTKKTTTTTKKTTTTTTKGNNTSSTKQTTTTTNKFEKPDTTTTNVVHDPTSTTTTTYSGQVVIPPSSNKTTTYQGQTTKKTTTKKGQTTTKKKTTKKKKTTSKKTIIKTDEHGQTQIVEVPTEEEEKTVVNVFLIFIGVLVIGIYVVYYNMKNSTKSKKDDIDDILNQYRR